MAATTRTIAEDFARAEAALRPRREGGRTFGSVRAALGWFFETGPRMQAAHGTHPRTEAVPVVVDGVRRPSDERVRVEVEGGRGGDLDEVFVTLASIARLLNDCARDYPRGCAALVALVRDGASQARLADEHKVSQATVSGDIGKAEAYLTGVMRAGGILR